MVCLMLSDLSLIVTIFYRKTGAGSMLKPPLSPMRCIPFTDQMTHLQIPNATFTYIPNAPVHVIETR